MILSDYLYISPAVITSMHFEEEVKLMFQDGYTIFIYF